jgi:hypothetical protein
LVEWSFIEMIIGSPLCRASGLLKIKNPLD